MNDFIEYLFVTDQIDSDYWNKVNDFWEEVKANDTLSIQTKNKIYDLCCKLVDTKYAVSKNDIVKEIDSLMQ